MIAKNIKGKSFKGCVNYVMNESCELLEAEGVWADTAKDMIRSFAMQRSGRKEIKQPVGHIPTSFAPEDKERMTNDFMIQLAKEYMQEMGIKNTQYIIVRHHNTDNEHLHIEENIKLLQVQAKEEQNYVSKEKEQAIREPQIQETQLPKVQSQTENKPEVRIIGGVKLTPQQWQILENGGFIYLEGLKKKDDSGNFSSYVFLNDEKDKAFSSKENPDEFVKYGRYEMRIRDKILIESGHITKAKVKWWGGIDFAYPYLWKQNKGNAKYKESWSDPRLPKEKKENIEQPHKKQLITKSPRQKIR